MPETYDEIIEEIEQFDRCSENYTHYLNAHGLKKSHQWASTDMALDIASRVREAVGGDPAEWWVEDADGNRVRIGNDISNVYSAPVRVLGLGIRDDRPIVFTPGSRWLFADSYSKIIPDTREKIIRDAMAKFSFSIIPAHTQDVIEEAVDRAMKLGEVDE